MSTLKSNNEDMTINADGASSEVKFQANGVEKASISAAGAFTSTSIDATKLTGNLPAISAANLTAIPAANITGTLPAISGANLTNIDGGKVLQVVQGTYSTQTTINTGNTLTKTGLLVDITPTAASSKILVLVNFSVNRSVAGGSVNRFDLRKDDTSIHIFGGIHQDGATTVFQTASGMYLDSPATTSATEYSLYVCGATSYFFNYSSTIIAMEIGA